jgi:hypothetical protein
MPLHLCSSHIPQGIVPDEDEPDLHLYPKRGMGGLTRFKILRDLLPDINTARWVTELNVQGKIELSTFQVGSKNITSG